MDSTDEIGFTFLDRFSSIVVEKNLRRRLHPLLSNEFAD
jgi:hypothetical protein